MLRFNPDCQPTFGNRQTTSPTATSKRAMGSMFDSQVGMGPARLTNLVKSQGRAGIVTVV